LTPKRREPCTLFLDDGFDSPEAYEALKAAGFSVVRFRDAFSRDGRKTEGVSDVSVIEFCARNKLLLITPDWNIEFTHTEEIKSTDIAVLATANNNSSVGVG
jgi:hypothetical protein